MSSHTPSLFWFRIDMMNSFRLAGHEVFAVGPDDVEKWAKRFSASGINYRSIRVSRNGFNPFEDYRTYRDIVSLYNDLKPDKVFVYQAKSIVYGCLAAWRCRITDVYPLVAGLGSVFRGTRRIDHLIRSILRIQYKCAFRCAKRIFIQNEDDLQMLVHMHVASANQFICINGSGVNMRRFAPVGLPEETVFLFIGRLIRDKGIQEYLQACRIIKARYPHIQCLLVGPFDTNPTALCAEELQPYIDDGTVEYFGEQSDVRPYIARASVFVLPSYHEGTPKTVLESMSMGRAIITTNAPGCRETVQEGINGYLIPIKNVPALANTMKKFIELPRLAIKMGDASRKMVEMRFDVDKVNAKIKEIMKL